MNKERTENFNPQTIEDWRFERIQHLINLRRALASAQYIGKFMLFLNTIFVVALAGFCTGIDHVASWLDWIAPILGYSRLLEAENFHVITETRLNMLSLCVGITVGIYWGATMSTKHQFQDTSQICTFHDQSGIRPNRRAILYALGLSMPCIVLTAILVCSAWNIARNAYWMAVYISALLVVAVLFKKAFAWDDGMHNELIHLCNKISAQDNTRLAFLVNAMVVDGQQGMIVRYATEQKAFSKIIDRLPEYPAAVVILGCPCRQKRELMARFLQYLQKDPRQCQKMTLSNERDYQDFRAELTTPPLDDGDTERWLIGGTWHQRGEKSLLIDLGSTLASDHYDEMADFSAQLRHHGFKTIFAIVLPQPQPVLDPEDYDYDSIFGQDAVLSAHRAFLETPPILTDFDYVYTQVCNLESKEPES